MLKETLQKRSTAALIGGVVGGAASFTLFKFAPATMAVVVNPIAGLLAGFLSTSMAGVAAMIAVSVAAVLVAAAVAAAIHMLVSRFGAAPNATIKLGNEQDAIKGQTTEDENEKDKTVKPGLTS